MVISSAAVVASVGIPANHNYALTLAAYGFGIAFYAAIIFVAGYGHRLLAAISTIIACGSLITLAFVAEMVLLEPVLGGDVAGLLATLIIFWSVPVEGHIIASTIERHWFLGIAIAMLAFIMQYGLQISLTA